MSKHPIADTLRARGNRFITLGKYEEALGCFINALELDPQISVAFRNIVEMESFITQGGREEFIRQEEAKEAEKQLQLNKIRKLQTENEADLKQRVEELKNKPSEIIERNSQQREEENERLTFNHNVSQLIQEIEQCSDEKPCPKCNEIEVLILSLSPNARSVLVACKHCQHEYRMKLEPEEPQKIIDLFSMFLHGRNSFPDTKNAVPIWRIQTIKRQITNQRPPIPSDVKKAVWKRDGGKCVYCGSQVDLEYDHIIPIAKGGSSTTQNIQILCKKCNRKKHASIS